MIFFSIAFHFGSAVFAAYVTALLHELSHVAVAYYCGIKPKKIVVLPFGITMKVGSNIIKDPVSEIKIAVAGPLSNIVMAYAALQLCRHGHLSLELSQFLMAANCGIAAINLFPALPLDGGRVLRAVLTIHYGYIKAFNTAMIVTKVCTVLLLIGGAAMLVITRFNFSLLIISAFLTVNMIAEGRGGKLIMMKEILYSREKIESGGIAKAAVICIMEDAPVRKVLRFLTYNKYCVINIVDGDMNIIESVTETKLIEALIAKGIRIKAWEVMTEG